LTLDINALLDRALRGELDEAGVRQAYAAGSEVVELIMLAMARRLAQLQSSASLNVSPATPSGMIPIYAKATARTGRQRTGPRAGESSTGERAHPADHPEEPGREPRPDDR